MKSQSRIVRLISILVMIFFLTGLVVVHVGYYPLTNKIIFDLLFLPLLAITASGFNSVVKELDTRK